MQTIMEDGHWRVTCRINKSDNLTLEIEHDGDPHAEVILQERQELGDDWTLRLGPLTHSAVWAAIEAFIGPPGYRTR
jgi:hypothetical protein